MPTATEYKKRVDYYKKMARDYATTHKEHVAKKMTKWRAQNKKRVAAYNKYHYWKNRPWHLERWKEWAKGKHHKNYMRSKLPHNRWKSSAFHAKRRGLEWSIPLSEYLEYLKMLCHYCQGQLSASGVGLDRLDNDKGYTIANIVPCCGPCNKIRGANLTPDEMSIAMKAVKEFRLSKILKGVI